jgi:hypothetical protein
MNACMYLCICVFEELQPRIVRMHIARISMCMHLYMSVHDQKWPSDI